MKGKRFKAISYVCLHHASHVAGRMMKREPLNLPERTNVSTFKCAFEECFELAVFRVTLRIASKWNS